ncbi:MAG: hypothetical protein JO197_14720 [Acidobacteria bacterium]|nr:hypothetical protein [Acidobacteriota bacterium]MBV9478799.1 hypothetical protein [Acidobacteriota bacterium]
MAMRAIGDDAVRKATGRDWSEWLRILDKEGARKRSHQEIVAIVGDKYGATPWWQQMVTVTYERERGLREVHQTAGGYVANVSRTIAAPVDEVYAAWTDGRRRARWLGREKLTVRKASDVKSLRITWGDDTNVDVNFSTKDGGRSVVAVEHAKLASKDAVAEKKEFWSAALARLKALVESA